MTEEQLIDRFNKINIELIHLKSQLDQLVNSISAFAQVDVRMDVFGSRVDNFNVQLESIKNISESNSSQLIELQQKLDQLDSVVNEGRVIGDPFDPTIHDYDNTPPA